MDFGSALRSGRRQRLRLSVGHPRPESCPPPVIADAGHGCGTVMAGEIFISYRRADAGLGAAAARASFGPKGSRPGMTRRSAPGQDWRIATAKALEASQIFVLLFSENAAQSSDIAKELAAATLEKKLIIPVRLENIAPKGAFLYELASRNWINAYEDTEAKLAELAKGLAHLVRTGARDESVLPFDRDGRQSAGAKCPQTGPPDRRRGACRHRGSATAAWLLVAGAALDGGKQPPFHLDHGAGRRARLFARRQNAGLHLRPRQAAAQDLCAQSGGRRRRSRSPTMPMTMSRPPGRPTARASPMSRIKPGEPCRIMVATVPAGEAQASRALRARRNPPVGFLAARHVVPLLFRPGGDLRQPVPARSRQRRAAAASQESRSPLSRTCGIWNVSPDGKSLLYVRGRNASTDVIVIRDLASGEERILGTAGRRRLRPPGPRIPAPCWPARPAASAARSPPIRSMAARPIASIPPRSMSAIWRRAPAGCWRWKPIPAGRIWRAASPEPAAQPDIIDAVNGKTWAPTFAPDGTLAFLSNRSGTNAIWMHEAGRGAGRAVRCRSCASVPPAILARRHAAGRGDSPATA